MTTAYFDALIGFKALTEEVSHLSILHQRIIEKGWPTDPQEAWITVTALAASVEKCYSGAEVILKNLLQELDGAIPSSADWHRQLIDRAGSIGPHGRPPVIEKELTLMFHDLRAFRHRERNSYVTQLDRATVLQKAASVISAMAVFGERLVQQSVAVAESEVPPAVPKG